MGWAQQIDEIWAEPPRVIQVKKQIWDEEAQAFKLKIFTRINCISKTQTEETAVWLNQMYGPPQYQSSWWRSAMDREIWMVDSLFTFWALKNPQ